MKVLIGHNSYQIPGGEDAVVKSEHQLLCDHGEEVFLYKRSNDEIKNASPFKKAQQLFELKWSKQTYSEVRDLIQKHQPDVAHFHNIFFLISPSAYYACHDEGVPVVQSQHNFRLLCSNGLFYRNNNVCEDCLTDGLNEGIKHGCYRNSRLTTYFAARMLQKHWDDKTWTDCIDRFIVAAEFTRDKYVQGGIPKEKISIKPNFVYPQTKDKRNDAGYALYVGRLSDEKGIDVLLDAFKEIKSLPLKIMGDGPLKEKVSARIESEGIDNIELLGFVSNEEYDQNMKGAKFLLIPSQCYENFPRIAVEAMSFGIPIIASRLGSLQEIIIDQETGLLFNPQDAQDLKSKINLALSEDADLDKMGESAFKLHQQKYEAKKNYEQLVSIYNQAINDFKAKN